MWVEGLATDSLPFYGETGILVSTLPNACSINAFRIHVAAIPSRLQ